MRIINLTPHRVVVCSSDGRPVRTYEPSGSVVRLRTLATPAGELLGVPLVRLAHGAPEGLPGDLQPGDVLIVSTLALGPVAEAVPSGVTVVAPDTGPESVVRDADGRIVGVRRLQTV